MAGEIKHSWTGTVLTITSDSGTSSCDLKGGKGDRGIRGAQGRAGVILNADGTVNMQGYATEEYVEDLFSTIDTSLDVDLSNYYTKAEIDATLSNFQPSGGGGGGGGGSSDNNATITLTNRSDWLSKTVAEGTTVTVSAAWSSTEDGISTGAGILTVTVDGVVKHTSSITQGRFTVNVTPYISTGTNSVRVGVTDVYGNSRSIIYSVNVVSLILESKFDKSLAYEGVIPYTYIPIGDVKKTMHFILDGVSIGSTSIATSGRQQTFNIPAQSHGSHKFEVYFESEMDGEYIESNHLLYDLICIESGVTTPIISCAFNQLTMKQFETVNIKYFVYNPTSLTSEVVLKANGVQIGTPLTVDRTEQTWGYRADTFGDLVLSISCGDVTKLIVMAVGDSDIDVEPVTENLELYLTSYGRSNNETAPNTWTYGDIACQFSGYNWVSDGWVLDDEGNRVHRVSGDARLTIPLKIFKNDFRTTGKTIEFEFATRDVRDYESVIISCMHNNIGFQLTAQEAVLKSEQSKIGTQYKEDEHIRLTFVVEKKAENRLVYIYLNGIMCGATQYPTDDDFSQGIAQNITIGSNFCTIDLYNIRVYNNDLTRHQVLDNWIADTQDIELKLERYNRNNVYDAYGNIVISKLPATLPYMILEAPVLPQFKGNKLDCNGSFVNPVDTSKNFTFSTAQADVQGTSSAGYARKNYKLKFKNGIKQGSQTKETYQMREDSVPTNTFTFKADVASSEGANNVELVRLYDRICPFKTPPQLVDSRVRQGIDGFPMVIFHNNGSVTTFIGKYNFNNDKGTPEVFGMDDNDESWEIRNNTSDRVVWKNDDFTGTDWLNDFEGRHPDGNTDATNLQRFSSWVKSTDRTTATNNDITPVTYEGITYNKDTAEYRLAKFRAEIGDYAELQSSLFYYLFTELFLMVDSRAKNAFPTIYDDSGKVCWLPYDMDTAIGINNEGDLAFGYKLEDIDKTETGADVYNGQNSVFWCNIRDCFNSELMAMYQELRSSGGLSYEDIENAYEEHQSVWCEAIWNEDAYYKYLEPLIVDGAGIYLPMLQGSKSEQRKWWLYNRFKYIDSKYNAGDANKDFITLRGYAKSDITVEPYADIYTTIKYGSYIVQERALKGGKYTLECPLDNVNDTEIYIYSASQLADVGDISGLKVGLADFSMATKLQSIKIGDGAEDYDNSNLLSLTLGNNTLLNSLDVRNCSKLGTGEQQSLDVSGCTNIEHIYAEGTAIKGITLPKAGVLKTLHLPDTITNLKLVNQTALTDFQMSGFSNISTLRLENTPCVDTYTAFMEMKENGRVRITNIDWSFDSYQDCRACLDKMDGCRGLDENDNNTEHAQISGNFHLPWQCISDIETLRANYPTINFVLAKLENLDGLTWAEIDELASLSLVTEIVDAGCERHETLTDGTTVTIVVLGFNHDNLSDGSGKARMSFAMKNASSKTTTSGSHYIFSDKLPADLKSLVKKVKKSSQSANSNGKSIVTSDYTYWGFSMSEILGVNNYYSVSSSDGHLLGGEQYQYFKEAPVPDGMNAIDGTGMGTCRCTTGSVPYTTQFGEEITIGQNRYFNTRAIKGAGDEATAAVSYWLRDTASYTSAYSSYTYHTHIMRYDGVIGSATNYTYNYNSSSSTHGYNNCCIGFCI